MGVHFDGQIRSADDWAYVRNILVRPGITYHFNSRNSVTLGYGFIKTYNKPIDGSKNSTNENRIWEQYIFSLKIGRTLMQNRFRLEQRFIQRSTNDVFAQRLRYFARAIIPVKKQKDSFYQGVFVALQDEIFIIFKIRTTSTRVFLIKTGYMERLVTALIPNLISKWVT